MPATTQADTDGRAEAAESCRPSDPVDGNVEKRTNIDIVIGVSNRTLGSIEYLLFAII
jgi:hypothetical protein